MSWTKTRSKPQHHNIYFHNPYEFLIKCVFFSVSARVNVVEDEVKEASEENLDPEVRGAQKEFR